MYTGSISILVVFLPIAFGGICSRESGPSGLMICAHISGYDNNYQWGTCLSGKYLKTVTMGRFICADEKAYYCIFTCMTEVYGIWRGPIYDDCSCLSGEELTDFELSLPSQCYTPSGTDCVWYNDCFKRKSSCSDTTIYYAQLFAIFFLLNGSFSNHGKPWIDQVRKCLQFSILSILCPWRSLSCTEVEKAVKDSHSSCYIAPHVQFLDVSISQLTATDYFHVFWTIRSILGQSYHSTNVFIDYCV